MAAVSKLSESSLSAYCPPIGGIPDWTQPKPLNGPDTRPRVADPEAKGEGNCWMSGLALLRPHFKAPNTTGLADRIFEEAYLKRGKDVLKAKEELPKACFHLHDTELVERLKSIGKILANDLMRTGELREFVPNEHLDNFFNMEPYETLFDYIFFIKMKKRSLINVAFFETTLKIDLRTYLRTFSTLVQGKDKGKTHAALVDASVYVECAKRFGLKITSWHPTHHFGSLCEELNKNGPILIVARINLSDFTPLKKKKFDRVCRVLKKLDTQTHSNMTLHSFLIVAAKGSLSKNEQTKGRVFLIDSNDPNDPDKPQPFYRLDYDYLTDPKSTRLSTIYGIDIPGHQSASAQYGFYREGFYAEKKAIETAARTQKCAKQENPAPQGAACK